MFYISIFIILNTPALTLCRISFLYISNVVLLLRTCFYQFEILRFVLSYVVVFEASQTMHSLFVGLIFYTCQVQFCFFILAFEIWCYVLSYVVVLRLLSLHVLVFIISNTPALTLCVSLVQFFPPMSIVPDCAIMELKYPF